MRFQIASNKKVIKESLIISTVSISTDRSTGSSVNECQKETPNLTISRCKSLFNINYLEDNAT